MRSGDFWEREHLERKSLPTLQDLVRCCDEELLARVIMDEHVVRAQGAPPSKRRRAMQQRLARTFAAMSDLRINKKANRMRVVVPEESFVLHGRSGCIERRLNASLVSLNDIAAMYKTAFEREPKGRELSAAALFGLKGEAPRLALIDEEDEPVRIAYALAPWEDTLASKVWLADLRCCRERYLVLAGAVWEMTYYGFEHERVVAGQARARASLVLGEQACVDRGNRVERSGIAKARAESFGLVEPDRFEEDYQARLAERVGQLNTLARKDFQARCLDLASRIEKGKG